MFDATRSWFEWFPGTNQASFRWSCSTEKVVTVVQNIPVIFGGLSFRWLLIYDSVHEITIYSSIADVDI